MSLRNTGMQPKIAQLTLEIRMRLRNLVAIALLQLAAGGAHACLFARDVQPRDWYEWSSALFSAEVTKVEQDAGSALDIVTVRIGETFKGAKGEFATLRIPNRMWASCHLERPDAGARVLVALNSNNDTMLVPLTARYAGQLRELRGAEQPAEPRAEVQTIPPAEMLAWAQTPAADPAKQLFAQYVALGQAYDPDLADLYANDALIKNKRISPTGEVRDVTVPAPGYKTLMRKVMPAAKARGDHSTYTGVVYLPEGERIRIKASRFSVLENYTSALSLLVGRSPGGKWLIYEELSESRP